MRNHEKAQFWGRKLNVLFWEKREKKHQTQFPGGDVRYETELSEVREEQREVQRMTRLQWGAERYFISL